MCTAGTIDRREGAKDGTESEATAALISSRFRKGRSAFHLPQVVEADAVCLLRAEGLVTGARELYVVTDKTVSASSFPKVSVYGHSDAGVSEKSPGFWIKKRRKSDAF